MEKDKIEKEKKRIITIERIILFIIIISVIIYFVISSGLFNKINPQKKFTFDWSSSSTNTFVNNELTPYCQPISSNNGDYPAYNGLLEMTYCGDQDIKKGDPPLLQQILKFKDNSSAFATLETLKSQIISDKQMGFRTFYLIENKNQNIYSGEMTESYKSGLPTKYVYILNADKYVFLMLGSETFKTKKLVQWIVEQYTGEKEISLNKTKEIFTLECGDRTCSSSIGEDCNSCIKDCSCQYNQQCIRKSYGEGGYECKASQGNSCFFDTDCAEGHCVHNYCRDKSTYCGDTYCDVYNSENPENCGNCLNDCFCGSDKQCINNECKVSLNSYCSYSSECASGYCVHSFCRTSSTYCGDYYCDYPETKATCSIDCYS